jgi:hypothetical protein
LALLGRRVGFGQAVAGGKEEGDREYEEYEGDGEYRGDEGDKE